MPLNVAPTFGTQNPGVQGFSDFFKSNGVSDQEAPYWASKWDALQQRGQQLGDPGYANRFLSNAETFTGSPEATARNMYGNSSNSGYMGGDNSGLIQQLMQLLQGGGKQYAQPYNPHQPNEMIHAQQYGVSPNGMQSGQVPPTITQYNPYGPGGSSDNITGPPGTYTVSTARQPFLSSFQPQTQVPTQSNGTLLGTTYQPSQGSSGMNFGTPQFGNGVTRPFSYDGHSNRPTVGYQNTEHYTPFGQRDMIRKPPNETPMGAPSFYQAPPSGGIQKPQSQGNMGMTF